MYVIRIKKKFFYSQPYTKRISLMLESEVSVMSKSLKLLTTIIKKMGGVDKTDAMTGNYSPIRKTHKWNIFFHFLEETLFNAFVVYINPLQSGVAFLYPLKTSENLQVF